MKIAHHIIVSDAEQNAIVNALAFYHQYFCHEQDIDIAYWRSIFREDGSDLGGVDGIDALATKVANP